MLFRLRGLRLRLIFSAMPWAIDLTHTSHSRAQTGIQQVCRALHQFLPETVPVVFDRYARAWRLPDSGERSCLDADSRNRPSAKRGPQWTHAQKVRGLLQRCLPRRPLPRIDGILCPEIFDPLRESALQHWPASLPRAAVFYDAIPLRLPQYSPAAMVKRFPHYLRALATFDQVFAISDNSARELESAWAEFGLTNTPPVTPVALGLPPARIPQTPPPPPPASPPHNLLMLGTFEARKNQIAVLNAVETLLAQPHVPPFRIDFIGMLNRETGTPTLELLKAMAAAKAPVYYHGPRSDTEVLRAFHSAHLVLYPSLYEGFGLPVIEALAHRRPVLASNGGALADFHEYPGVITTEPTATAIASALQHLLTEPDKLADLQRATLAFQPRSMADAARAIAAALKLPAC